MVQRKPPRKRPKDPGAVLLRRGAALPPRGDPAGNRGGGVARAPLPVPGYMRATSCSDARAAATGVGVALPPPPKRDDPVRAAKVVFTAAAALRVGRVMCSSTLKGPGDAGGARVCTYGYCSLKGHAPASAVAPLGAFVASRRRLIKTQQSMKLKGASPFRKPNNNDGRGAGACAGDGFFVGTRAGAGAAAPTAGSDVSCSASDLSAEEEVDMMR